MLDQPIVISERNLQQLPPKLKRMVMNWPGGTTIRYPEASVTTYPPGAPGPAADVYGRRKTARPGRNPSRSQAASPARRGRFAVAPRGLIR